MDYDKKQGVRLVVYDNMKPWAVVAFMRRDLGLACYEAGA